MYKSTALGQQFLTRQAMHSTKGSRRGFDLLDHGENPAAVLEPEQSRDSLVAAKKRLTERLTALPKNCAERRRLGLLAHDLDEQIRAIRPKAKCPGAVDFFISVARERLTSAMFDAIMNEAVERAGKPRLENGVEQPRRFGSAP